MSSHKLVLGVVLCLVCASLVLAADTPAAPGVGKIYTVTLVQQTRVATALLPAGDYRVQHVMEGEKHFMVFKNKQGTEVRVQCTMVKVDHKANTDMVEYSKGPNGERVLAALVFKGEMFEHRF